MHGYCYGCWFRARRQQVLWGAMAQSQAVDFAFEAPKTHPIYGTRLVAAPLDRGQALRFDVRRVYCIYAGASAGVRGEHATAAHCALVALQGSVEIDLDNGSEQASVHLSRTDQALCIHAGVWLRVRDLSSGAIVLFAASRLFSESVYFDRPSRELLDGPVHERWT